MDAREGGSREEFLARVRGALATQVTLLDERLRDLEAQRRKLDEALTKLSECDTCFHRPGPGNNFCQPCQIDGRDLPADLSALF
jgi:hypothetical protein